MSKTPNAVIKATPFDHWTMRTALLVVFFLGVYAIYSFLSKPMAVTMSLPIQSIIFMDEYYEDFPNGDYLHCIRVKVTDSEFRGFVKNMSLAENVQSLPNMPGCQRDWWNINLADGVLYGESSNSKFASTFAAYRDGYLYYVSQDL